MPASELLQEAIRTEIYQQDLREEMERRINESIGEIPEPSAEAWRKRELSQAASAVMERLVQEVDARPSSQHGAVVTAPAIAWFWRR